MTAAPDSLHGSSGVVTGASGFIGRAVVGSLPAGCRVFAAYHSATDFPDWTETCRADVVPVRVDLAAERLADHVPAVNWALLLAARVATAASRADPVGELTAVAGVTANSMMGLRADHVVHLSSGSVYETLRGELSPGRVLAPRLPYSIAKLAGELLFRSYAERPYWNVRFFGAFGPGEPPFKLAYRLAQAFAKGEREFVLRGDGSNYIDPMYITDAAAELSSLLTRPGESRTVDLAQGEGLTIREFVEVAYYAVHPSPYDAPLVLVFEGEAHEQMFGTARTDESAFSPRRERLTIAEGFARYAERLGLR
jgi:nucleoside-diphosphate-sugar epimerase